MFLLTRPGAARIAAFLAAQRDAPFSYPEVGATGDPAAPPGYTVDRNRVRLGAGAAAFARAVAAMHAWRMSTHGWAFVAPRGAPIVPGATVAVVVRHYGFWSLNACRLVDAAVDARRAWLAYGTLPEHGAIGEERFAVEWREADDGVWFEMYAFSRPGNLLARLGYPLGRRVQRRFVRAALRAMADAVG